MNQPTTKIVRSKAATLGNLAGGAVGLALCVWLCGAIASGPITTGIALIPGVVGLILIYMAVGGSGATTCPGCGSKLTGLSTKSNDGVHCSNCHGYFEGKGGLLSKTDEHRVAESPIFTATLPPSFQFPAGCCVCGMAEARRDKVSMRTQNASSVVSVAAVGMTSSTITSVDVPHCAVHNGGALLGGTPDHPKISFRSYPYMRAFCQLNGATPG
jgi:hypothetical protein